MKKLKENETVATLVTKHGLNEEVYRLLRSLLPGERILIETKDWKGKTGFYHSIYNVASLRGRYSVRTLADRSGWEVTKRKK